MSNVAETAVIAKLLDTESVVSLVGQRVHPRLVPQGWEKPYIVVMRPSGQQTVQTGNGPGGVAFTPIIVALIGETYDQSRSLCEPVFNALTPLGWLGSEVWGGVEVAGCFRDDAYDRSQLPVLADEIGSPVEFLVFNLEHGTTAD